jgi:hypothetical protein
VVDTVFTIVVFTFFYVVINPWKLKRVDPQDADDNPSDSEGIELLEVNTQNAVEDVRDTPSPSEFVEPSNILGYTMRNCLKHRAHLYSETNLLILGLIQINKRQLCVI